MNEQGNVKPVVDVIGPEMEKKVWQTRYALLWFTFGLLLGLALGIAFV